MQAFNWTHQDVIGLTFPQLRYYAQEGKPLKPGQRRFRSVAERNAYYDAVERGEA